jgi:cation:H+ antiporter
MVELLHVGFALVLLLAIITACTVFTNAVEWLGHKLNLSEGVVGSLFAAVGTALPETLVPIIALVSGLVAGSGISAEASHEIGVGAILGAPFMLATLAMMVTALGVLVAVARGRRDTTLHINPQLYLFDMRYFLLAFGMGVGASFLPAYSWLRWVTAALLLLVYLRYVLVLLRHEDSSLETDVETHLPPLYLAPKQPEPALWLINTQIIIGLMGIIWAAHAFVHEVQTLSQLWQVPAFLLSMIIIPIATELPEKFNSVMWVQAKKDQLALGNLTGAMVFQSCIPVAIGVAFTPWVLDASAWISVAITLASVLIMMVTVRYAPPRLWWTVMLGGGVGYLAFVAWILLKAGTAA